MKNSAFEQASFIMSLPFILVALICLGVMVVCHKVATILSPDWDAMVMIGGSNGTEEE